MFQSRNRGSFDFKSLTGQAKSKRLLSFNLVIEVLLISSLVQPESQESTCDRFNLVIEVLLISRKSRNGIGYTSKWFQSRNRGSFDFKHLDIAVRLHQQLCFNLVIEVLLISSHSVPNQLYAEAMSFQSRNRGSFDFKTASARWSPVENASFNLVIEVLLISRSDTIPPDIPNSCFNLVIEVLLISRKHHVI